MKSALLQGLVVLAYALFASGDARAQDVRLTVGFAGEIVADAWNPIRLTMRDQPDAELRIDIDQGSLRQGEQWIRYRARVSGGSGLSVFEDDLYVPSWRALNWQVATGDQVLASGSIDSRRADNRPLTLVVAERIGGWAGAFSEDARIVDIGPQLLPERTAAYYGVATLLIDGSTAPPDERAVLAAAVGGVRVILAEPLPRAFDALLALAPGQDNRYGAGSIARVSEERADDVLAPASRVNFRELAQSVGTADLTRAPIALDMAPLGLALVGYVVVVLLLLRFAGAPGLISTLALGALAAAFAWSTLRPADSVVAQSRALHLGSQDLAVVIELKAAVHLPEGTWELDGNGYPLDVAAYRQTPRSVALPMQRWSVARVMMAPRASPATLRWRDGHLENRGAQPLTSVLIVGHGMAPDLAPHGTWEPSNESNRSSAPPDFYEDLMRHLPAGSAVAVEGDRVHVALPAERALAAAQ